MPTKNQLVRKGRKRVVAKDKTLDIMTEVKKSFIGRILYEICFICESIKLK